MKILLTLIALIIIVSGFVLYFYKINLSSPDPCYDITLISRRNYNYGFAIKYKNGFELWRFSENQRGGCAEKRIFPK